MAAMRLMLVLPTGVLLDRAVAKVIADKYVRFSKKAPWMVDLLNINLTVEVEATAEDRVSQFLAEFANQGVRITKNLDFA